MSNAALVQEPQDVQTAPGVSVSPGIALVSGRQQAAAAEFDPHPLVTVLVAMILASAGAATFIGIIVACLALRHTGVMAP